MSTEADTRTSVELPTEIGSVAEHRRRGLIFIGLAAAGVGLALHVQIGVNANFVRQVMGLTAAQQGVLEALRESWGIIALVVLALAAGIAEPLLAAGVLVLLAAGLGGYALVPTFGWLIAAGMVWSSGFHVWVPLPNSMTLALAEPGRVGHRLGQIRAAGALGSGIGLIAALVMGLLGVQIRPLFLLAGGAGSAGSTRCTIC